MKSSFDLKHGIARITPESIDDVYLLEGIITPGSFLKAKTLRSREILRGDERVKGMKELILIAISVEKISFSGSELRVTGKIVEGPEYLERGYHTIEIEPGTFFTLQKAWKSWEIDKIKKAAKKHEKVLITIIDESEADLFLINERTRHVARFTCSLGKKSGVSTKLQYFADILNVMKKYEEVKYFFVAGPAFAKEDLLKHLKEKDREVAKKIIIETVSQTGELGMQEFLKSGALTKVIKLSRLSEETSAVERLLEEISKDGLAVYGLEQTKSAIENGAVETLLVSDKKVRSVEGLLERAEAVKTKIMIISSEHQAGEKLLGLGGIAGFLRYRII